jgi:hypothetical protein
LFFNEEKSHMKYLTTLLSNIRPIQFVISIALSAVLAFVSSFPALAANKGIDQLPQIEEQSKEALDNPANSLKEIEERSQGALNEVQPKAADRDKMYRSNETKLPAVKQVEKAIDKMKHS